MPPRLLLPRIGRATPFRQWPLISRPNNITFQKQAPSRSITADERPLPVAEDQSKGPNQEQLPHVSEEAAATAEIVGEDGPDLSQGTPVQEVKIPKSSTSVEKCTLILVVVDVEA